jgi:integrase
MGLRKFTIFKYVKLARGWRYCKPAVALNHKIKPDVVLVNGTEEKHPEGAYYLNVCGNWVFAGKSASEAQEERARRLAKQEYERLVGKGPSSKAEPEDRRIPLQGAVEAYLSELDLKVGAKIRRPKTYAACQNALREFVRESGVTYLSEVSASTIAKHMQWCVEHSPSQSSRTAHNKFLLVLQFLKHCDAVPMVGTGKSARKLCMKDAPRYVERPVSTYKPEDLARFFAVCDSRERAIFETFNRAGLREMELATLRREDCHLAQENPTLEVCERPEYAYVPKTYEIRSVSIDPLLASLLRGWLASHDSALVFPSATGVVDGHLLRLCKAMAKRAKLDPTAFWLHKFRATYATFMLRQGIDLETLREQMGHKDVESLRRYLIALKGQDRGGKVAEAFKNLPIPPALAGRPTTAVIQ